MFGFNKRKNSKRKAELGFLILNLIAEIDGFFHFKENNVIKEFIASRYNPSDKPMDFQPALTQVENEPKENYLRLLAESGKEFSTLASTIEQSELMLFALQLVNADEKVASSESKALVILNTELNIK